MLKRIKKRKCHIFALLMSDMGQITILSILFNINDPLSNKQ